MTEKEKKENFIENSVVYIHGEFDKSISFDVLPNFRKLIEEQKKTRNGKIIISISSYGGYIQYVKDILGLVEEAKKMKIIIETRVASVAFSCGSLLACSGTKGHRYIAEYAEHLCHLGSGGLAVSSDLQLERQTKYLKRHFDFVRNIYAKNSKIPNLDEVIKDDYLFISGKESIKWELADKLI